jgi:hypothetical protein
MRRFLLLVFVLIGAEALFGCAARREAARALLPTADTVCIVLKGVGDPGASFVIRKAALYLGENGFRIADVGCDVTATYTNFNQGEWEVVTHTLLGTKSTNAWRAEGVVALSRGATTVVEDERIDLRDYSTMQDLLDELASSIVEKVVTHYRPSTIRKSKGNAK